MKKVIISSKEEAKQFLKETLGLRVDEPVVRKIVAIHRGESNSSFYELYAAGKYRDGRQRNPICGNGTIRKVREFCLEGKLDPYLTYVDSAGCPGTAPTPQLLVPSSFPSPPVSPLPAVLFSEVDRIFKVALLSPARQMEPTDSLGKKIHWALRDHPGMETLAALLDSHGIHLAEFERVRGYIAETLQAEREEYSKKLLPDIIIHPWDKQVLETFDQRVMTGEPEKSVPESRTYEPTPDHLQDGLFCPAWGGFYMTRALITDEQYEVVHQLHVEFTKVAEQFLPELINAAVLLKMAVTQLRDELEDIIVRQQLGGL